MAGKLKAGNILQKFQKMRIPFFSFTACFKQFQYTGKPNHSHYSQKKTTKLLTLLYTLSFVGMQKDMCFNRTCLFSVQNHISYSPCRILNFSASPFFWHSSISFLNCSSISLSSTLLTSPSDTAAA